MKTVLHILNSRQYSGAENVAITIIKHYSSEYTGVYVSPEGTIREKVEAEKIRYIGVDKLSPWSLRKVIKEVRPDVIHAHDFTASVVASLFSKRHVVISHLHINAPWMKYKNVKSFLYKMIVSRIKRILVVSESIRRECWFGEGITAKTRVIGNPVDLKTIRKGIKENTKENELLFVGRLTSAKNPEEFIEIVKVLVGTGRNIRAVMLGSGELEEECKALIEKYNLEKHIEMLGFIQNPYTYMAKSKILVMPSQWEGFGLVAVEAMALKVPVIANPVGGLKDIVTEECGLLCEDVEGKVVEIEKLLTDENYYDNKSQNAYMRAEQFGKIEKYMTELYRCYCECDT